MPFYKLLFIIMITSPILQSYEEGEVMNGDISIIYRDYGPKKA